MTKEKFCKILKKLEDTWLLEETIHDLLWDYGNKYKEDVNLSGFFPPFVSDTMQLLAEIMDDDADDIGYFCWELNFGKAWRPGTIIDANGNDIDFSTAEKLYDYLEENKEES